MPSPTYALAIDLDRDELFSASEVKTGDVVSEGGGPGETLFEFVRGHDLSRVLSQPRAGSGGFWLDNRGGAYSVGTTLAAGQRVRLRCTYAATTYDLVQAILDEPVQAPIGSARQLVRCALLGPLSRLAGKKVSTALYQSITTGQAIGYLLDAAGAPKNIADYFADLGNLVGYWKLNETSGTTAADSSGSGNNGTYQGSPTLDAADLDDEGNGAPDFNGTTQYVSGSDAALPAGSAARSIVMRVNLDVVNVTDQPLFAYGSIGATQACLIEANNANVRVGRSGANAAASTGSIVAGTDTTVIVTISAAGAITYYLQGVAAGTATLALSTVLNQFRIADALAGWGLPSTGNGRIGHVAVFSDVLTAAECAAIHARFEDAPRHLDAGQTTLDYWWLEAEDAMAALNALKATEGPGCAVYEDGTGAIVFKNRHARLTEARSTAVQTTFRTAAGAAEPLASLPFDFDPGTRDIVNQVTTTVKRRALGAAGYRWQTQQPYASVSPGETKRVALKLDDPGTGFVTGLLATNPTYATTLAAALNASDLTFTVPTGEAPTVQTNAVIDIDGEYMVVTGRTTGSPNDTVTVSSRGAYGSTAASHLISAAVRTRAFVANSASNFAGTDLTGNIAVSLDRTSGQSATFTFTNNGTTTAHLFARLYGRLASVQETYQVTSTLDASASQAAYGVRTFPLPLRAEIAVNTAQDLCHAIVGYQQDGRKTARFTVKGIQHADRLTAALSREISDRIRLVHAGSGIDEEMYIESIGHRVIAPASHVTTFECEEADGGNYFTLGTSALDGADVIGW